MTKKIIYKKNETQESILAQLKQNKIFNPLLDFMLGDDLDRLTDAVQKAPEQEFTVAELKKKLFYKAKLDEPFVSKQEYDLLTDMFEANQTICLRLPYIIKVDKKNLRKLMRLNRYCHNSGYLFHKIPVQDVIKSEEFYLPFLQLTTLLAAFKVLPDEQKISVAVLTELNPLLRVKAMHALNKEIKDNPKVQPSSATLIMSEDCNLRCIYCYEPSQKRDKTVLSFEKAKQVLRKFDRDSNISFFGGEPMLHIDLMKQICEWGWEYRNFKFEMVTNGQIIDRDFLRNYARYFTMVQLSCDGPEAAMDINRGHGSFKRAMEFYKAFREETGKSPVLHPVLSKYSLPYLFDTIKWFYEMETKDCESPASLRWLPGDSSSWGETDFNLYAEQLQKIKEWYLTNDVRNSGFAIRAFAQAERDMLGIENQEKRPLRGEDTFCAAGTSMMAVLPSGNLIPCHHEYWVAPEERVFYEEVGLDEEVLGVNHMSEICMRDLPECNACPQWGCCVCPGSFYFHGRSYTTPDKNWCRAGKMLIETAKSYAEELAQKLHDAKHKTEYLAAGVDYLLQKELKK